MTYQLEMEERNKKTSSWKRKIAVLFVIICTFLIALLYIKFKREISSEQPGQQLVEDLSNVPSDIFINDVTSAAKEDLKGTNIPSGVVSESENYRMKEVSFGGYEVDLSGEVKNSPLEINNIRSEPLVSKDGKSVRLLISWNTNKLAKSEVSYQKGSEERKIFSEEGAGLSHALILSDFDFDSRYTYQISARDRWGGEVSSDNFAAYTGTKNGSIIEVIMKEFREMFKWLSG